MGQMLKKVAISKGADYLSVILGPEATVDKVRASLTYRNKRDKLYNSYSNEGKLLAQLARYTEYRKKVLAICYAEAPSKDKMQELCHLSDIWPDVDLEADIAWMEDNCKRSIDGSFISYKDRVREQIANGTSIEDTELDKNIL